MWSLARNMNDYSNKKTKRTLLYNSLAVSKRVSAKEKVSLPITGSGQDVHSVRLSQKEKLFVKKNCEI